MELDQLGTALRSAIDLNAKYYAALLKLSTDYLQSLGALIIPSTATPGPASTATPVSPVPPLLLAARAGEEAQTAFAVTNSLSQPITARVVIRGDEIARRVRAVPETMMLQPGEHCVVKASLLMDASIEVNRDVRGEFAIPELSSQTVPFVVRRLPDSSSAAGSSTTAGEAKPEI
jgi:hypothetical protein